MIDRLFYKAPEKVDKMASHEFATALGASIYSPATRENLYTDIIKLYRKGASSIIICLEDSVPDERLEEAEQNLLITLKKLKEHRDLAASENRGSALPALFIRVRTPEHLNHVYELAGNLLTQVDGFAFPKFHKETALDFVTNLKTINASLNAHLYYMPILESSSIIYRETRHSELQFIKNVVFNSRDICLAIRIGATDLMSTFGIRRSRETVVHDIHLMGSIIGDIMNYFGREGDDGAPFVISGTVWEHFTNGERLFKPTLRSTPFETRENDLRRNILKADLDALIREIDLDMQNGITGKTVIHPTHVGIVNSMLVVTHEQYVDAQAVLNTGGVGGAENSEYRNKMNESKPHYIWAQKIMARAKVFGVLKQDVSYIDLWEACIENNTA